MQPTYSKMQQKCIETALTWEQLNSPKLIFSVIRPMQDAYMKLNTPCTSESCFQGDEYAVYAVH